MPGTLSIGELARRTGLPSATLRAWESRYGFPIPDRDAAGRRVYRPETVLRLRQVIEDREKGLGLSAAISRAQSADATPIPSLNAFLRRSSPALPATRMPKRGLAALTRAIEDEGHARAGGADLIAAGFQEVAQYERVRHRWDDLVGAARNALIFTNFPPGTEPGTQPTRITVRSDHPLTQEWFVIWCGSRFTACLSGRELPGQARLPNEQRVLETVWTVSGDLVVAAAQAVLEVGARLLPVGSAPLEPVKGTSLGSAEERDILYGITNRMMAELTR